MSIVIDCLVVETGSAVKSLNESHQTFYVISLKRLTIGYIVQVSEG